MKGKESIFKIFATSVCLKEKDIFLNVISLLLLNFDLFDARVAVIARLILDADLFNTGCLHIEYWLYYNIGSISSFLSKNSKKLARSSALACQDIRPEFKN